MVASNLLMVMGNVVNMTVATRPEFRQFEGNKVSGKKKRLGVSIGSRKPDGFLTVGLTANSHRFKKVDHI